MRKNTRSRRRKKNQTGKIYIAVIMLFMIAVMTVNIISLYRKNMQYKATEESLEEQLLQEQKTQEELAEYEQYVGSDEYIEDEASEKLGLTHDNWIIFKEKQD